MQAPGPHQAPVPGWIAATLIILISITFSSNHVAARLAFDHGVSVLTAVTFRSGCTAIVVLGLVIAAGVSLKLSTLTLARAAVVGVFITIQSYCLYASVARLPVALALLTFNTFPIVIALLAWALGGERPRRRTLIAMPIIFCGLALALDALQWIGDRRLPGDEALAGIAFALGASVSFGAAMVLTQHWLVEIDGRLRSVLTMTVVGVITFIAGATGEGFHLPTDSTGWVGLALLTLLYGTAITALFVLLPRIGAVNNSPIMNIEPIAAMVIAWLALGQSAGPAQIVGALMVVGAIIFLSSGRG